MEMFSFATNLKFLIHISLQAEGKTCIIFQIQVIGAISQFEISNDIKLENQILWQKFNSFAEE